MKQRSGSGPSVRVEGGVVIGNVTDKDGLRSPLARRLVFSVPQEPLWRLLNISRGAYLGSLGNTPGHLNHWSARGFRALVEGEGFRVLKLERPMPWTVLLAEVAGR